ncbi:MAG: 4Fe-4S binding protein [Arcobacteraceae bacterium]
MDKEYIIKLASSFVEDSTDNRVNKNIALSTSVAGMKIFDEPIFAFGSTDDPYFQLLENQSIVGKHFINPKKWLPGGKTVISFFLPFTESVRKSNTRDRCWPSEGWLHGRIEGHEFLLKVSLMLKQTLEESGYKAVVPFLDEKYHNRSGENYYEYSIPKFNSNWSERHVAFICGLGTFGLSKGLITKKGVAGRFGSIITDLLVEATVRNYNNILEYCSKCGICAQQCPANAISLEKGKDHVICSEFLDIIKKKYKPRYGCGKCQVNVPCEHEIPKI